MGHVFPYTNVKLPKGILTDNTIIKNFEDLLDKIKVGLNEEAIILKQIKSYKGYEDKFFNDIKNILLFKNIIIKIYTAEGFVYRRINKIMRDRQFKDQSFQNLKYYYIALMYSLQEINRSPSNKDFTLFRGFLIDRNKIKHFKEMKVNNLIILYEFLSTTL